MLEQEKSLNPGRVLSITDWIVGKLFVIIIVNYSFKVDMDSFITEDIESLLKLKKGDSDRLNRIKNLYENKKAW